MSDEARRPLATGCLAQQRGGQGVQRGVGPTYSLIGGSWALYSPAIAEPAGALVGALVIGPRSKRRPR
jgi:hypothetical protein